MMLPILAICRFGVLLLQLSAFWKTTWMWMLLWLPLLVILMVCVLLLII